MASADTANGASIRCVVCKVITAKMYGSGNKYMKIFEVNTNLLENPDKIFPGQELVIPDLDE